ncbi:MAG: phage/plasmid primase, family [Acidimicrobiaceae bacterium]|nr:phage/plasmid primase, family [Acidimicrobiaceae bacterium]
MSSGVDWVTGPGIVDPPERCAQFESSDLGNARRLVDAHGEDLRYAPQLGRWLAWDGKRWCEDLTGEVMRRAKSVADYILDEARAATDDKLFRWGLRSQSASSLTNMVTLAESEPGIPVLVGALDADSFAFNVRNGTINLGSGELRPHDRRELVTKLSDVDYDPDATCPTWLRTLEEVFAADAEVIRLIQRFTGYSLTGDVSEQKMSFGHGSGSNGKTTILNALRDMVGEYGMHLDPAVLIAGDHDQHPTGLTDLRGARLVTTVETEQGRRLNESLVKMLTGGDPIRARRMRQDYFEFMPTHKLWFAGNHLPRINGTDYGIWRRIVLIPFEVEFGPERADKMLPGRLAEEASGILAWAVQGCLDWQRDGLRIPERVSNATAAYRQSQDHIGRFLVDTCIPGDTCYVKTSDLRSAYEAWCADQGERPWTATAVGRELTSRGFDTSRIGSGNAKARTWLGLGLLSQDSES